MPTSNIDRVLQTHGWEEPGPQESDRHDIVLVKLEVAKHLGVKFGPLEQSSEHRELEQEVGLWVPMHNG